MIALHTQREFCSLGQNNRLYPVSLTHGVQKRHSEAASTLASVKNDRKTRCSLAQFRVLRPTVSKVGG